MTLFSYAWLRSQTQSYEGSFFLMPYLSDNKIIREDDVRTLSGKREDYQNKEDTNEKRK